MGRQFLNEIKFFILLTACLLNHQIAALDSSHPTLLHPEQKGSFHDNYTVLHEIGRGTYSTVYLCQNRQGEKTAVKQYEIKDPQILAQFENNECSADEYVQRLAKHEWEIGQRVDHPNIVKVKEVLFEGSASYVVMDCIEGKASDLFTEYSPNVRLTLMRQFLSAVEYLLLRNVIVDDLWSENMLISNGIHLILIDLGGYEVIGSEILLPLKHYLKMIERVFAEIGGDVAEKALKNCRQFLPAKLMKETLSPVHVRPIVFWIEALQEQLSTPINMANTISQESSSKILKAYAELQSQYPQHLSFCTAQHSKFLAYSMIAAEALKKINPGLCAETYLRNVHFVRYPFAGLPKNLEQLFQQYPLCDDYDTSSSYVGDALISASPSLKESESQESAWGIFENNERKMDVANFIHPIFEAEKVSLHHFDKKIKKLVKEAPKSKTGLIYQFFIPKDAPLHHALYLSKPYGIPEGDPLSQNQVLDFYAQYAQGQVEDQNPQLRFLPSALTAENHFNLEQIKSFRLTTIPQVELESYAKKIKKGVDEIYQEHLEEMLQLAVFASEVEGLMEGEEQQKGFKKLCDRHLRRLDHCLALYYWNKLQDENPLKIRCMTGIIACLLKNHQLRTAERYFQIYEGQLMHESELAFRFAIQYIEQGNRPMLELMLKKLSGSNLNKVLILAQARYPDWSLK